ncbi:ABC transporter permease [Uniformispora flossi]|uniref:ABC transporter permease n=1 Tax=Uniformispora flossi TaxID=3390723 RepID=UPI003C2F54F9
MSAPALPRMVAALRSRRPGAKPTTPKLDLFAYGMVVVLVTLALIGPWLTPYDPYRVDLDQALRAPEGAHWLGTDASGRDVASRLLAGARETVLSGIAVVVGAALLGTLVAVAAVLGGRWADEVLMRVCDIFLSVPGMVLALGLAASLGTGRGATVIAMVAATWPAFARLVRSSLHETMRTAYVESARVLGVSRTRLMLRHVLPNSLDTLLVQAAMEVSGVVVIMSGLAFLGVGAQPPSPDWGAMVSDGREYATTQWWIAASPGAAITVTAIAFGLAGDALRVRLDPTVRGS